jgi:glycosyltransferase involved in cell wall biosynthesis
VPAVVIDGVTGRRVAPADPEAVAAAVLDALSSPAAAGWGQAGAELVARDHGIARMIAEYEKVYDEVLSG